MQKIVGAGAKTVLSDLTSSPAWEYMGDEQKQREVSEVMVEVRRKALTAPPASGAEVDRVAKALVRSRSPTFIEAEAINLTRASEIVAATMSIMWGMARVVLVVVASLVTAGLRG